MNIGVFDSGVGGLWILRHLQKNLPEYNYIFVGDQCHVPYGKRSLVQIKSFSEEITRFLVNKNCQLIVIACNTASAAALKHLRQIFPDVIFVGMEPAVRPAVLFTHTKKVGVLATPATFQGELYNSVVEKFAEGVQIFKDTCPGLVDEIEKGELNSSQIKLILEKSINPMIKEGVDTIVLGCTHYPFVIPEIEKIVENKVKIIDPTDAIGRRVKELSLNISQKDFPKTGKLQIYTSGQIEGMEYFIDKVFKEKIKVSKIIWDESLKINVIE